MPWIIAKDGPKYWAGKRDRQAWSYDPREAVQFARQQDAHTVKYWTLHLTDEYAQVVELTKNHGD